MAAKYLVVCNIGAYFCDTVDDAVETARNLLNEGAWHVEIQEDPLY